jgi:hypothetical protein
VQLTVRWNANTHSSVELESLVSYLLGSLAEIWSVLFTRIRAPTPVIYPSLTDGIGIPHGQLPSKGQQLAKLGDGKCREYQY